MRDLIVALFLLGIVVGIGCGTAQAQYKAESPNYSLEYVGEASPGDQEVAGVEFTAQAHETGIPHEETLPATNSPWTFVGAFLGAVFVGAVFYFLLK